MDVLNFFELVEEPFRLGPDTRFLYLSDQVKSSIGKCIFMIKERVGPIYLYGPIGAGKTSILKRLRRELQKEDRCNVVSMISPNTKTSNAFLKKVMNGFGVETKRSYGDSLDSFESFLIEQKKLDKIPVLIVDEAQYLNRDSLKLIHYLLNFETSKVKLLQIVLAGQEELATKIIKYHELASRMFSIAINNMSPQELGEMIKFRWKLAGGKELPFIDEESFRTLYAYTKGLPRDAIKLSDEMLRMLASENQKKASAEQIDTLARSLNLSIQMKNE